MLADDKRALYHAGAAIASNFLVTLYRVASGLLEDAGAPPEALVPLMKRTIDNGFELTGPVARGDWETVERHRAALSGSGFEQAYDALVEATRTWMHLRVVRTIAELDLPRHGVVGLVPTMGALHAGHTALFRAARPECDVLVASVFVNPAQFSEGADLSAYPRDPEGDLALAAAEGIDVLFAPGVEEMYPPGFATWVDPARRGRGPRVRPPPAALPRRRDRLPEAAEHRAAAASRGSGARTRSRSPSSSSSSATSTSTSRSGSSRPSATPTGSRSRRATRCSRRASASRRSRSRARSRPATPRRPASILAAAKLEPDYVEVADLDGPTLAIAARSAPSA